MGCLYFKRYYGLRGTVSNLIMLVVMLLANLLFLNLDIRGLRTAAWFCVWFSCSLRMYDLLLPLSSW